MKRRHVLVLAVSLIAGSMWVGEARAGGCHASPGSELSSAANTDLVIAECAFREIVTYVEPGQSVTWVNKDPIPHTVTGAAYSWGDESILNQKDTVSYSFDDPGVFPYYCALHPSMVGVVVVGEGAAQAAAGGIATGGISKAIESASASSVTVGSEERGRGGQGLGMAVLVLVAAAGALALRRGQRIPWGRRKDAEAL